MEWLKWTCVAVLGMGVAILLSLVFTEPVQRAVSISTQDESRRNVDPLLDPSMRDDLERADLRAESMRSAPDSDRTPLATQKRSTGPRDGSPIDEELRLTEQALAATQRIPEPTAPGGPRSAPRPSPDALLAATRGSSARALGCEGAGLACRSTADCCPGLACDGGVAGYGTVGHCGPPR